MLTYPHIDPVALHIGPLKIYWYGIMYLLGFVTAWGLGLYRAHRPDSGWTKEQVSDLVFYCALGVVIGGRLGYVFFYAFDQFLQDPLMLFKVWQGGMAFHGGLLGVLLAAWWYGRTQRKAWHEVTDFVVPLVPIGLACGRVGNFINGYIWGRVTDMPWGMVFPLAGPLPRHPVPLYEFFFEGIVLFIILWVYSNKPRPKMAVSGMFLLLYGVFRFVIEYFRQPDPNIVGQVYWGWLTMGHILTIPMILGGVFMLWWGYRKRGGKSEVLSS